MAGLSADAEMSVEQLRNMYGVPVGAKGGWPGGGEMWQYEQHLEMVACGCAHSVIIMHIHVCVTLAISTTTR